MLELPDSLNFAPDSTTLYRGGLLECRTAAQPAHYQHACHSSDPLRYPRPTKELHSKAAVVIGTTG
jgi:hypothetical protein